MGRLWIQIMVHESYVWSSIFSAIEDGGEMVVMSITLAFLALRSAENDCTQGG